MNSVSVLLLSAFSTAAMLRLYRRGADSHLVRWLLFKVPAALLPEPKQVPARPDTRHAGLLIRFAPPESPAKTPPVRRRLTRESGRALEMLGHAIEYLADEYAADTTSKGPLGRADPRVEAIQLLKSLNRAVYYSGTEVQPVLRRIRRWFIGRRSQALGA